MPLIETVRATIEALARERLPEGLQERVRLQVSRTYTNGGEVRASWLLPDGQTYHAVEVLDDAMTSDADEMALAVNRLTYQIRVRNIQSIQELAQRYGLERYVDDGFVPPSYSVTSATQGLSLQGQQSAQQSVAAIGGVANQLTHQGAIAGMMAGQSAVQQGRADLAAYSNQLTGQRLQDGLANAVSYLGPLAQDIVAPLRTDSPFFALIPKEKTFEEPKPKPPIVPKSCWQHLMEEL